MAESHKKLRALAHCPRCGREFLRGHHWRICPICLKACRERLKPEIPAEEFARRIAEVQARWSARDRRKRGGRGGRNRVQAPMIDVAEIMAAASEDT